MIMRIAYQFLRKRLSCQMPLKAKRRCKFFLGLQMKLLPRFESLTRLKLKRFRGFLQSCALALDNCVDTVQQIKNPLCFHERDEITAKNLDSILDVCSVPRPLPLWLLFKEWNSYELHKIDEGSFGQVYKIVRPKVEERIIKITVAFGFHHDFPNDVILTDHALPDAVGSKCLSSLREGETFRAPNFPLVYRANVGYGDPPQIVVDAWKNFKPPPFAGDVGFNQLRPEGYSQNTLHLITEMENCGIPILQQRHVTPDAAMIVFLQTASALAVAEEAFQFEHRDLHNGNLLFKRTKERFLDYKTWDRSWKIKTCGIHTFIIDFTLSRISSVGAAVFLDMAGLVINPDDSTARVNFLDHHAIYRLMMDELQGQFNEFKPKTNLLWLRYIAEHLYRKAEKTFFRYSLKPSDIPTCRMFLALKQKILLHTSTMEFLRKEILENIALIDYVSLS